jgi:uncharacterized membrane protein YgdD (TMEM256/DUF423 family)
MQQPPDDFVTTDIRHFLAEAWRIIRLRRWHFVIAFLCAGTLAFAGSLFVPRKYSATTILKRESDPALAGMIGKGWTERYAEIRQQMASDLGDMGMIKSVLVELSKSREGSVEAVTRPPDQEARKVSDGLIIKSMESSSSRDVVALTLTLPNGDDLVPILHGIRDRYVEKTRSQTTEILRGLEQFFVIQADRSRNDLESVRRETNECELRYPGVNPDTTDPLQAEQSLLAVDRAESQRQRDALQQQRQALEKELAGFDRSMPSNQESMGQIFAGELPSGPDGPAANKDVEQVPNPQFTELQSRRDKLTQEIVENRTLKAMTDNHPVISRLRASLDAISVELGKTPEFLPKERSATASISQYEEKSRIVRQISDIDSRLKTLHAKQDEIQAAGDQFRRSRLLAIEHREEFLKLRQKSERIDADLNTWQQNVAPIRRLLTLENSNRGLHFTAVGEIETTGMPAFPAVWMVLAVCMGAAAAGGVITVAATELLDRSYRTARQLASLGVPVIRMIEEIVTRETQKSRVLRRLVVIPSTIIILLAALLSAGTLAIRSLEAGASVMREEIAFSGQPQKMEVTDRSKSSFEANDENMDMGD